jgi:AraC family transcriptional regulator of adaptative response/methylated-DNA-[protein]-cysteine methyltransferase
MGRDACSDGAFVYGVRSTGIYCRPSCPSRRPKRKYVVFFETPDAAERQGFRACLRCHPRGGAPNQTSDVSALIKRVCMLIERKSDGPPRLETVAEEAGVHPARLHRLFRKFTGITVRAYADAVRVRRLKQQLRKGDDVTTALYEAGFGSPSRLYERSDRHLGMTPATYRRGGRGMEIRYATAATSLGRILVAGTARGICAIYLGDTDPPLVAALRKEYLQAGIRNQPARVSRWVRTLVRHIAGGQPRIDLPIDVAATAFQRRVWEVLQRIPYGATRSYSELARLLGRPTATRAVARACATNPVCVLIPCHRVVRQDGALGGYRWGIARKQALIDAERRGALGKTKPELS